MSPDVIPSMPASTTAQVGVAAQSTIAGVSGPVELIVGLFLAFLIVGIMVRVIAGSPEPTAGDTDAADFDDPFQW